MPIQVVGASLVAQLVKNLPAMQETFVGFLGWEAPLEKGLVTHSSTHAWRIPWTEEPGITGWDYSLGLQPGITLSYSPWVAKNWT